jgi:hypothetical protein
MARLGAKGMARLGAKGMARLGAKGMARLRAEGVARLRARSAFEWCQAEALGTRNGVPRKHRPGAQLETLIEALYPLPEKAPRSEKKHQQHQEINHCS